MCSPVLEDRRPGDGTNIGAAAPGGADYRLQQLGRGGPVVSPGGRVDQVLAKSGQTSRRQRHLPAPVVVYYVVAPALDRPVCYREGRLYSRPALPRQRGSATHWLARRYSKP